MDSLNSDTSNECLVTDLVHELSSGLEIPFLLRDDISVVEKEERTFHCDPYEEKCFDGLPLTDTDSNYKFCVKNEIDYDNGFWHNSNIDAFSLCQISIASNGNTSSCGSGSGSECSSTEMWLAKNELDTPPVTPPDERISPDNTFLSPDELKFIPIIQEDYIVLNPENMMLNTSSRIQIQPQPNPAVANIGTQEFKTSTIFQENTSDTNVIRSSRDNTNIFFNSNKTKKKSVLSKKDFELQAKRKQERMIRNRESAYLSRKRKKEHVACLEKQVQDLITENRQLRHENYSLRQKLANYEEIDLPTIKKTQSIFTNSTGKATALFALLFTFCLNFGSFSSLLSDVKWRKNEILPDSMAPAYSNEMRYSRSLLWAESDLNSLNMTFDHVMKPSCPAFINQSESIRLESELRRWIGGEDDSSNPLNYNVSKISQYFYSGDKPQVKNKPFKRKAENKKLNSLKNNKLEMEMIKMKSNLLNFNTFFEVINRRDDTFYLVSFSGDHLLLPALSHNKTTRPKMSLMLPAFLSNVTGTTSELVEMMQIDCEVTNTQVLSVNESNIPPHMRHYSNLTAKAEGSIDQKPQKFEDFFLNQDLLSEKKSEFKKGVESTGNKNEILSIDKVKKVIKKSITFAKFMKYQDVQNGMNSSTVSDIQLKYPNNYQKKKVLDNIFSNDTFKEGSVNFVTKNVKSLLKMVKPNLSNTTSANESHSNAQHAKHFNGSNLLYHH